MAEDITPWLGTHVQQHRFRILMGLLIVIIFLIPLLYVLLVSFETSREFAQSPLGLPRGLDIDNYARAWSDGDLGPQILNTVLYSAAGAGAATVLSLLMAFPLARRLLRVSEWIYRALVLGFFLPIAIIPLFIEARLFDLYNNRLGYIILHVEPGIPLGVLVLTAAIRSLPVELDEAAQIDGCSYGRYLIAVIAPLSAPGMVITFLYAVLNIWNDIIGPTVYLSNNSLDPVSRGLLSFQGQYVTQWTLLMAAVVLVSLPVLFLFIATQGRLIRANIAGSVK